MLLVLIVLHAGIFIAAINFGESTLTGRVHVKLIACVGIGALLGISALAKSSFSMIHKARTVVLGKSLSRSDAPTLWGHIDVTADRLGALRPNNVVVGLEPNFFVTEAEVVTLQGTLVGRTLFCSLPLSRILTVPEFTAIVGHELGHFRGDDIKFSHKFYPIYRGSVAALRSLSDSSEDGVVLLPMLPAIAVLSYFLECFSEAESEIGRDRELVADACGKELTSAAEMATALIKVHAFAPIWSAFNFTRRSRGDAEWQGLHQCEQALRFGCRSKCYS